MSPPGSGRGRWLTLTAIFSVLSVGCASPEVEIIVVQLNDVYEIGWIDSTRTSNLSRVAARIHALRDSADAVVPVIAGDFVSPSALGTAMVGGERLGGRQMVRVLNGLGMRYAAVGNHEFDVDEDGFAARAGESRFEWISANLLSAASLTPLDQVLAWDTLHVRTASGLEVVLGVIGATMTVSDPDVTEWVSFRDPEEAIVDAFSVVDSISDLQIAITHLPKEVDRSLARALPDVELILGGHEHYSQSIRVGHDRPIVTKADANARTVWVHRVRYNYLDGSARIESALERMDDPGSRGDPVVDSIVRAEFRAGILAFEAQGFRVLDVLDTLQVPLDGLDANVRIGATNLTERVGAGMLLCSSGSRFAVFNSGMIRIDDEISPGPFTTYDVLRVLPYPGKLLEMTAPKAVVDSLLRLGLDEGRLGSGAFLQAFSRAGGPITVDSIDALPDPVTFAVNSFLAADGDRLGLRLDTIAAITTADLGDIRHAFSSQMRGDSVCGGVAP